MATRAELAPVIDAIARHELFVVTTHENPDGDALGSLVGMHLALGELAKDSVMVLGGELPLPAEYDFLGLESLGLRRSAPDDVGERVLLALDCAQESRIAEESLVARAALTVNVDHHHDNTRFGDVDLVVADASSTGEVVADLLEGLDVRISPSIAEALYTAVVTDTGRFQYANTTPKALRLAASLIEAGADVSRVFREVYESAPLARLKLLGRAVERTATYADGRVLVAELVRSDFADAGADEPSAEGIIDHLRSVEGTELVVLVRELPRDDGPARKGSLRSKPGGVDVSAIARSFGGGGHRQAAGFSTDLSTAEVTERIVTAYEAAAADSAAS